MKVKPRLIQTSWYRAAIDVTGKHLSGLFLLKVMPDQSRRIVFTNEAGVKFFDFEFSADNNFRVDYIIAQLDKKVVINLLRDDFSLLLGIPFQSVTSWQSWTMNDESYFGATLGDRSYYVVTQPDCRSLARVESGSEKKKLLTIQLEGPDTSQPEAILLQHYTFAMTINLKKIEKE